MSIRIAGIIPASDHYAAVDLDYMVRLRGCRRAVDSYVRAARRRGERMRIAIGSDTPVGARADWMARQDAAREAGLAVYRAELAAEAAAT